MRRKYIWQDWVLMIGGFAFTLALIPAIAAPVKPPIFTSLMTGAILVSFCVVYLTLRLRLAFVSTALTCGMWFTLLIQRLVGG